MRSLFLSFVLVAAAAASAQSPVGLWAGPFENPGGTITFAFRVSDAGGGFVATMDIPEQGAEGIPTDLYVSGDSLVFSLSAFGLRIEGTRDGDDFTGAIVQGARFPFAMVRQSLDPEAELQPISRVLRPQEPREPFPYRTVELAVASVEGVTLAGTLTLPDRAGPFPAVVLVPGSGPQDRDWDVAGHQPAVLWADRLAREGIASYRYDERGLGASTGDVPSATTADLAADASAAARALDARADVSAVGVVGHSEGGIIAPLVAGSVEAVDFVVLLAGSSVSGADVLADQNDALAVAAGQDVQGSAAYARGLRRALEAFVSSPMLTDATRAAMEQSLVEAGRELDPATAATFALTPETAPAQIQALAEGLDYPWMRYFLAYDPRPALDSLDVPTLAVFGGLDAQVTPRLNLSPMREALAGTGSPHSAVVTFEGLNHLLQPAVTGAMSEYGEIETTVSEEVLDFVTRWIAGVTG